MVNAVQATTILEVGCGSGMHSESIAKNYLRKGALLVSCDVSTSMLQQMSERYLSSDVVTIKTGCLSNTRSFFAGISLMFPQAFTLPFFKGHTVCLAWIVICVSCVDNSIR